MITNDTLLGGLQRETDLIKHIATKVATDQLDFRFTPGQRSTRELLRYIASCAITPACAMLDGNWERAEKLTAELDAAYVADDFGGAMDRQMQHLREVLGAISPEDAVEKTANLPWGEEVPLGASLIEAVWKTLTTYRVQLFLQTKAGGATEIDSHNLWIGRDASQPQA